MIIEEKNLAIWAATPSAIALVPAARFKVPGNWEDLDAPYIIQSPVSEISFQDFDGIQKFRIWDYYQFSIVSPSYLIGATIAEKVRQVFNGNIGGVDYRYRRRQWISQEQDKGVGLMAVDFRIAESL